jgi:hypothetical protein
MSYDNMTYRNMGCSYCGHKCYSHIPGLKFKQCYCFSEVQTAAFCTDHYMLCFQLFGLGSYCNRSKWPICFGCSNENEEISSFGIPGLINFEATNPFANESH